jgi:3',5'-cyclic AMP phosphodiesterase CpdA
MMNSSFRFAHISDLHLTSLDDVKVSDLLNKRALGYLSWRLRRRREHAPEVLAALLRDLRQLTLDHIVITGDLTHIGLPSEFQQARQWLETLGAPTDVTVVPGNHETYVNTAWDNTFALWTPYMASDSGLRTIAEQRPSREFFPSVRVRRRVALIGLTSACPTAPFLATGSLGPMQLKRLEEILDQTGRQELFRILLIHHPPVAGTVGWRKRLTDGPALSGLLARHGVEMVLHGHAHRPFVAHHSGARGPFPVIGVPSSSALGRKLDHRARYNIYEVSPSPAGWAIRMSVRGYVLQDRCFIGEDQHDMAVPRSGNLKSSA